MFEIFPSAGLLYTSRRLSCGCSSFLKLAWMSLLLLIGLNKLDKKLCTLAFIAIGYCTSSTDELKVETNVGVTNNNYRDIFSCEWLFVIWVTLQWTQPTLEGYFLSLSFHLMMELNWRTDRQFAQSFRLREILENWVWVDHFNK